MPVGMQSGITKLLTTTGPQGHRRKWYPQPGIDFIDASDIDDGDGIRVRQQKWPELGTQAMPPKPAGAMAPEQAPRGNLTAECP